MSLEHLHNSTNVPWSFVWHCRGTTFDTHQESSSPGKEHGESGKAGYSRLHFMLFKHWLTIFLSASCLLNKKEDQQPQLKTYHQRPYLAAWSNMSINPYPFPRPCNSYTVWNRLGSLKTYLIPVNVFNTFGIRAGTGRVYVYRSAIFCLFKLSFIFWGVKKGKQP